MEYPVQIGHGDARADLEAIFALRGVIGDDAKLAVDYNQSLSVTEALERVRILDDEGLYWIEDGHVLVPDGPRIGLEWDEEVPLPRPVSEGRARVRRL